MNEEEHRQRHELLHKMLDELVADYIRNTSNPLTGTSVMELMMWSHRQTICPDDPENAPTIAHKLRVREERCNGKLKPHALKDGICITCGHSEFEFCRHSTLSKERRDDLHAECANCGGITDDDGKTWRLK